MKIKQISKHIWSLKTWLIVPIHVWLIKEKDGLTLVDAGIGLMGKSILKQIELLQAGPLQQILLTHGHIDHVGSIPKIFDQIQIPIHAHSSEIPYINGELPFPGRKKASVTVPHRITQPLPEDKQGNLNIMGSLKPYHTPGHSPGHVVYYHEEDQVLIAGDLFTSKQGKLYRPIPMFTANMEEAIQSSEIIRRLNPKIVEVCHGSSIRQPINHLDNYIQETTHKYCS